MKFLLTSKFVSLRGLRKIFIGYSVITFSCLFFSSTFASLSPNPATGELTTRSNNSLTEISLELFGTEGQWFNSISKQCNALEVELALRQQPPPSTNRGAALAGLCYAFAGKAAAADKIFDRLNQSDRIEPLRVLIQMAISFTNERFDPGISASMEIVKKYLPKNKVANYLLALTELSRGNQSKGREMLEELRGGDSALDTRIGELMKLNRSPQSSELTSPGLLQKICPSALTSGEQC